MTPSDIRLLIDAGGLSNREAAAALGMGDDSLIRKWKRGGETPNPERAQRLIDLVAETFAAQLLRALDVVADGRVNRMRLSVNADDISLDGIDKFSPLTQIAIRAAFTARLMKHGLKIEQDDT